MNMLIPDISIIVPVYKAENYLNRCVDSILAQTFTNFELILVDDGSPDGSGAICDKYAKNDNRVKVIHKENGGVASARQCGIDNAKGEYIIHADPDDWVEQNMLEELYNKAESENADMVICDFWVESKECQTYIKQKPSNIDHLIVMRELFQHLHGSCWNKFIRRNQIEKNNVKFLPWMSFCEDLCFNINLLKHNIKISYHNKAFYHYDTDSNPNSIVKNISLHTLKYDLKMYEYIDKLTDSLPANDIFKKKFSRTCVIRAFRSALLTNNQFKNHYNRFAHTVCNYRSLTLSDVLLYLSCKGYYKLCYYINKYILRGHI